MRMAPVVALAALVAAAACAGRATKPTPDEAALMAAAQARSLAPANKEARAAIAREDPLAQLAFWAKEHDNSPGDLEAARALARLARELGQPRRATEVAAQALALHPDDPALLITLGGALIEDGRAGGALEPLERAVLVAPKSASAHLLLGAAHDHVGGHEFARERYRAAMALVGESPALLSNLGLSFVMSGDPKAGEPYLRRAVELPGADARARQNLALALALQGRFAEAERLAQQDLPAAAAQDSIAYVQALLGEADPPRPSLAAVLPAEPEPPAASLGGADVGAAPLAPAPDAGLDGAGAGEAVAAAPTKPVTITPLPAPARPLPGLRGVKD